MGRYLAFAFGTMWIVLFFVWKLLRPIIGVVVQMLGATPTESDGTYKEAWAQSAISFADNLYGWMQVWGPYVSLVIGLCAVAAGIFWKRIESLWNDNFGMFLRIDYNNECNLPHKHPAPLREETSYPPRDGDPDPRWVAGWQYFIGIENVDPKRTIEDVTVRVIRAGRVPPSNFDIPIQHKSGALSVDIPPMSTELFYLGYSSVVGEHTGGTITFATPEQRQELIAQEIYGLQIKIGNSNKVRPLLNNNNTPIYFEIRGKNTPPTYARFIVGKDKKPYLFFERQSRENLALKDAYGHVVRPSENLAECGLGKGS